MCSGRGEFPYAPERKYTPCDAAKSNYSAYAIFSALTGTSSSRRPATARTTAPWSTRSTSERQGKGVAFVGEEVTDAELKWMDQAGVRGVRFNFIKRLVDFTPQDELIEIAAPHCRT